MIRFDTILTIYAKILKDIVISCSNNSFAKSFLYSPPEFIFFKTDVDGENSVFCTLSVQFQISILFAMFVCEIGTFLNTNRSDINAVNCSFPYFSKFSITPRAVSGTITFGLLSLVRWSWVKGFTVMHLTNRLTAEENRWLKDSLSSWYLLLDSAGMSLRSKQSSNSSITRASSGLHTSHRRRAELSSLLSKSLAFPALLIILLFCSWIWSNPFSKTLGWTFGLKSFRLKNNCTNRGISI